MNKCFLLSLSIPGLSATMKSFSPCLVALAAVGQVSSHYIATTFSLGSTKFAPYDHIRRNINYNSPVTCTYQPSSP